LCNVYIHIIGVLPFSRGDTPAAAGERGLMEKFSLKPACRQAGHYLWIN